jgi:VCBS repeat-containing protein
MPNASEVGGGNIDIEVVATQRDADDLLSFGTSEAAVFEIAPLVEFLYPLTEDAVRTLNVGDLFASVRVNTNAFQSVTATISGVGVADTIVDSDDTDNANGVFNFLAETAATYNGNYSIDIVATDTLGNETRLTQSIVVDNTSTGPSVTIMSPTTAFTNEVFSPAQFTWVQSTDPEVSYNSDDVATDTTYSYAITQISQGSGYYPKDGSKPLVFNFLETQHVDDIQSVIMEDISIVDGRLPTLPETITVTFRSGQDPDLGFGLSGAGVVDSQDDPGAPSQVTLAAEIFPGTAALASYQMYVNGALVKQSSDPAVDPASVTYPGSGSILPGNYVLTVQVTDVDGNVTAAKPRAFEILPYEPPVVSLERTVETLEEVTDPLEAGGSATFTATVDPVDLIEKVVFFESISGEEIGEAELVIDTNGEVLYRQSIVFAAPGNKKVYAQAIGFDGRATDSPPVNLSVILAEPPSVSIDSPLEAAAFAQNSEVKLEISATDSDGSIAKVEVFDGAVKLGEATLTDGSYTYSYYMTGLATGPYTLSAQATDNLGLSRTSEVNIRIYTGELPTLTAATSAGETRYVLGEQIELTITATDTAPGTVSTVEIFNGEVLLGAADPVLDESDDPIPGEYSYTIDTVEDGIALGALDLTVRVTDSDDNNADQLLSLEVVALDVSIDSPVDDPLTTDVDEATFTLGDSIDLEITARDLAPGFITQVEVLNGEEVLGLASLLEGDQHRYTIDTAAAGLAVGTLNLSARATDNSGNVVSSDIVAVDLLAVATNSAPSVTIDSPLMDESFDEGSTVTVEISATDSDGSIATVEVFNGADLLGEATLGADGTYSYTYDTSAAVPAPGTLAPGTYTLSVEATDDLGASSTATVTMVVGIGAVPIVSIDSPVDDPATNVDETQFVPGDAIVLEITATDPDFDAVNDDPLVVEILNGEDSLGLATLVDGTADEYSIPIDTASIDPGTLNLTARAIDSDGNSADALLTVELLELKVSIDIPANEARYTLGDSIDLEITARDLAPGFITQVEILNGTDVLGEATLLNADQYRYTLDTTAAGLVVGTHSLSARGTDNSGNVVTSDSVTIDLLAVATGDLPTVDNVTLRVGANVIASGGSLFEDEILDVTVTATDKDGIITAVEIFNGIELLGEATLVGSDQYRYVIDSSTAGFSVGRYALSAKVIDDRGNVGLSDPFVVDILPRAFSVTFTNPTTNPFALDSASVGRGSHHFEIELSGVELAEVQSVVWLVDGVQVASSSINQDQSLLYSQEITLGADAVVTVVATNSLGIATDTSVIVELSLADPLNDDSDFVADVYQRLFVAAPTEEQREAAMEILGDPLLDSPRASLLKELLDSDDMNELRSQMMVYRTMLGEWPDLSELNSVRAILAEPNSVIGGGSQSGSIASGASQTFEYYFTTGDVVSMRVTGDGTNGNALSDPTLTIYNPSGVQVAYDDGSGPGFDALIDLIATETGTYTATVAGYFSFDEGDFTISTAVSNAADTSTVSAQSLVQALIPQFESRFALTFPTASISDGSQASALVGQLFENKHGSAPSAQNWNVLSYVMTGEDQLLPYTGTVVPGYAGSVGAYAAAFATDNALTQYAGETVSSVHYYEIPNSPVDDVPLALLIATFLEDDPTAAELAKFSGLSELAAIEAILNDSRYTGQFTSSEASSPTLSEEVFVALAMLDLGSQSLVGPEDDADGDGQSNLLEIVFGGNPVDSTTQAEMTTQLDEGDFVYTFILNGTLPTGFVVYAEYSCDLTTWSDPENIDLICERAEHPDVEGYECVELRYNIDESDCGFVRLTLANP